jgi:glycosyltransferase involved in cell wall biosynthesis
MVVYLPPPDTNPYLRLLSASLQQRNAAVRTMPVAFSEQWLSAAQPPAGSVLHFHWPHYGYQDADRERMRQYVQAFQMALDRAASLGLGIVWTAHNLRPHESAHPDLEQQATQALLDRSRAVIVHCEAAIALLRANFRVSAPCAVIPHGHYIGVYGPPAEPAAARHALGLPPQGTVYLSFGQVRAYRGLEYLLEVFASLAHPSSALLIAGHAVDPPLARKLLAAARAHPLVHVHPFFIPDREVSLYFGAADVVVQPYAEVLTSGTAVLAHSMSRPVIAPSLGCLTQSIPPGTGWLYDPASPHALRDALQLAHGPLTPATAARCRELALRNDWRSAAEKTLAAYGHS